MCARRHDGDLLRCGSEARVLLRYRNTLCRMTMLTGEALSIRRGGCTIYRSRDEWRRFLLIWLRLGQL